MGRISLACAAADALNDPGRGGEAIRWSISALPTPNINQAPANPTTATTATFGFNDAQTGGSFVCSLDSAAYAACVSGVSYSSLASGAHSFAVEYENGAAVLSSPATWNWTIAACRSCRPAGHGAEFWHSAGGADAELCALSLTYTFASAATLGSPVAMTEGALNLDFAVTGGTCSAGASFSTGNTCTVNLTFTPKVSGLRRGALLLTNQAGGTVAMVYLSGIGSGPQVALLAGNTLGPGSEISIGGGFAAPLGIAVDGAGNTYIADNGTANSVKKVPAGCTSASCVVTLATSMNSPYSIAVDGAGNVYVGEIAPSQVQEIPYGCTSSSCIVSLGGGFYGPEGIAVDTAGNVFVADYANNAVKEIPAGCTSASCVKTLGRGLIGPEAISVDANDNASAVHPVWARAWRAVRIVGTSAATGICASRTRWR